MFVGRGGQTSKWQLERGGKGNWLEVFVIVRGWDRVRTPNVGAHGTRGWSIWASLSASPDAGGRLIHCKQSNIKNWSQTLHYKCVQTFPNNLYMAQGEDFGRLVCVSYVAMLRNPHLHLDIHSAKGRQHMYSCLISFGSLKKKKKTNKQIKQINITKTKEE